MRNDILLILAMSPHHAAMPRRLPPLTALRAFEAASRNPSFTHAAAELAVTQGAVSRHVAALEEWLGVVLFERKMRGVSLTPKGAQYARIVRGALDQIEYGARQLQQAPEATTLRLKVPPTFAIRWLVPRLARFHAQHRDIDLQITTSHQPVDFDREDVDACIHSDPEPPPHARFHRLFGEIIEPVCSPGLLQRDPTLRAPEALAHQVLISSMHRPRDWPTWLAAAGVAHINGNSGLRVENSALAYQAAVESVGVVIAQRAFVDDDLRNGRLVAPFALPVAADGSYYFGYPTQRPRSERVAAFEAWIVREAARTEEQLGVSLRGEECRT